MKISVTLQRDHISRDETCEMEPGGQVVWSKFLLMFFNHDFPHFDRGICDFGRSPFGCQLLLSVDGEEPQSLASWTWLAKKKMNDGLAIVQVQIRTEKFRKIDGRKLKAANGLVWELQGSVPFFHFP